MLVSPLSPNSAAIQLTTFNSYVVLISDPTPGIVEKKLKAAQELSENFETIMSLPQYPQFQADAIRVFMKLLEDGEPQFIADQIVQQLRKLLLEIIHRMSSNDHLKKYVQPILSLMFKLIKIENEENVLVCVQIIIKLHQKYRPQMIDEIKDFLKFVYQVYTNLPSHLNKIFLPRTQGKVKDIAEINLDALLQETYTVTTILTDKKVADNQSVYYNIIPRSVLSLKVLAELPIILVLMYQLYKQSIHQEIGTFIPLVMNTIILQPLLEHRNHPAFNKEVFVDFVAAQIKTLSFLAYIIRSFQEQVQVYSQKLVQGHLNLLVMCPQEAAHLRKDLLIAVKHILSTDFRNKFVNVLDKLFDESILIGNGWSTYESLRPLAYSTLADLVHHMRQELSMSDLSMAVNLFLKNVHDETLLNSIQVMSCKLLLSLVNSIQQKSDQENGTGRELLIRMLEVFVLKFKMITKIQLPQIMSKSHKQPNQFNAESPKPGCPPEAKTPPLIHLSPSSVPICPPGVPQIPISPDTKLIWGSMLADINENINFRDERPVNRFGVLPGPYTTYSVADCRVLVKTLVCGVKTITWGILSCKAIGQDFVDVNIVQSKQFLPKETLVYVRLVKYALEALDIYNINVSPNGQAVGRPAMVQTAQMKEEKEVLEHFAGMFTMLNPLTFKEIFTTTIEYVVDSIHKNNAFQIIASIFMANPAMSTIFASIVIEYLLARLKEMDSNTNRSNLYLKLFKLVFASVSLFPTENERMLKPHLHTIVNRSMELGISAKEPYNYFMLLRALFRSIGGGIHELLYQEFLPLLPNLLQGLNNLQSDIHQQLLKDLFVELCLTVPVRLSSLLPYLPLLMDPLVLSLNGSQMLVSQGLKTIELCIDNLQPDFLYEHLQPVNAELMQALWRILRHPVDSIAQLAFRVLGKLGGGNRKMLHESQKFEYNKRETFGPCVTIFYQDCKVPIALPAEKAIDEALVILNCRTSNTYYRRQAWDLIKFFLVSVMNLEDDRSKLDSLFNHPSFSKNDVLIHNGQLYKNPDSHSRKVHENALTGMFVAASLKELHQYVLKFMGCIIRHYTMVAISQQCGPFPAGGERQGKLQGMDTQILIDALMGIMGHEEKELCKAGNLALALMLETATLIMGSKVKACQLPLFKYLMEKMCSLCYERAWYAKFGGCFAVKTFTEKMSLRWMLEHQFHFLKALLFVMMDSTDEVSNGAVELSKTNLEIMLVMCACKLEGEMATEDMLNVQKKSFNDVTYELVRQVISPNMTVRETAMKSLETLAKVTGRSVTSIMETHKEVLQDMIPPKKHLLRHQPANIQLGLMDGNTFCMMLNPRLFTIDLSIAEHSMYITELQNLCDAEDSVLQKLPCYKSITNLLPLRKCAFRALGACLYISNKREKIFKVLFKALNSKTSELQEVAHECMKNFIASGSIEPDIIHRAMRPLLLMLGDYRNLDLNMIQRLSSVTQLFPNTFNEKLCEQLLKWLEMAITNQKAGQQMQATGQVVVPDIKVCAAIINIFHLIPAASKNMIEPLMKTTLNGERTLVIEPTSPFREPLSKFLARYPLQTVEFLMNDMNIRNMQYIRYFVYLLSNDLGQLFRDAVKSQVPKLVAMLSGSVQQLLAQLNIQQPPASSPTGQSDPKFQVILLTHTLVRFEDNWLSNHPQLVACLKKIWISDEFQADTSILDITDYTYWKVPSLLVKCLLNYFKHNTNDIEMLFHILRCFTSRNVSQYQFVKEFLDNTVATTFPVEWKRRAFFKYVEVFHDAAWSQILKAKIIQYVLMSCFQQSFESGEGERLMGSPPQPDQDNPENIISVFINKVIDPENPFVNSDTVRILLLQFSSLLVEHSAPHIHDVSNKKQGTKSHHKIVNDILSDFRKQGNKLRRLMAFAWPCLLTKNCVDPATKYHGHLLLSHIIAKFAIHKRIVLQVFHSLLKAHTVEARAVVRQALEILMPAMTGRMEDGDGMLAHWTKKIIVEEGHSISQSVHILELVVKHFKLYYPVRHHIIQHMVNSLHRLSFTQGATMEQKKLAVDLTEVILKWEIQRIKEEMDTSREGMGEVVPGPVKRVGSVDPTPEVKKPRYSPSVVRSPEPQTMLSAVNANKPIEKQYCDAVVDFLLRIACQGDEVAGSPGEVLSRRCINMLKTALRPDVWFNTELKPAWFDKLLNTVEIQPPNFNNICTSLELLYFLLTILTILEKVKEHPIGVQTKPNDVGETPRRLMYGSKIIPFKSTTQGQPQDQNQQLKQYNEIKGNDKKDQILTYFKPIQQGIAACMKCPNNKVIRAVHSLLLRLMSFFPTAPMNSGNAPNYEELDCLYACINKLIYEGLTIIGKAVNISMTQLFSTLMVLKVACIHNHCYIDRLMTIFFKVLTKMTQTHLAPNMPDAIPVASELLILGLDLVKNRVGVMSTEMRKSFIGHILVGLIEKTPDRKIMKAITKMVEDWVKTKDTIALNQSPTIREKTILLVKLMVHIEKRFSNDQELNVQFLELVIYIYRDNAFSGTELASKLEQAFLAGLRYQEPSIRRKFVEVFHNSIQQRVYDRLLYITCSQNWEAMGNHFWVKQCIELVMAVTVNGHTIQSSSSLNLLPSASSIVSLANSQDRASFATIVKKRVEQIDVERLDSSKEDEEIDVEFGMASEEISNKSTQKESPKKESPKKESPQKESAKKETPKKKVHDLKHNLQMLLLQHAKFLKSCREVKTIQYLAALTELCHNSTELSHTTWIDLFPRIWKVLSDKQQKMLETKLIPFICSGSHVVQKDCHPSAMHTFVDSLALCVPPILIQPSVLKYIGKTHNLWHRSCLLLEQIAFNNRALTLLKNHSPSEHKFESTDTPIQETLDALIDLYALLKEEDMWAGLWQKRAQFTETNMAIAYEQHGLFEQAQNCYEAVMMKARVDHNTSSASLTVVPEYRMWEDHWIRCSKELNQWDHLQNYASSNGSRNPHLVLECAWRVSNWALMKDALSQVEHSCPKELAWKINLYRGYIAICHPDDHHLNMINGLVELSSNLAIKEWRHLPLIITNSHVPLLQAAQQIMELQEAAQISEFLQRANITGSMSLHETKGIVKTWRNRMSMISDDLSHWSDIFTWRQHHHQFIENRYNTLAVQDQQNNHSLVGVHASAEAIIQFSKIARKHNLCRVCLDSLNRLHSIPSVPIVDCFQKIRQQVKCHLQMAESLGKPELNKGLEVIESTNLKFLTKEMIAEFYALKGTFLAQIGHFEEANKSFSAAVQMHDTLVKAWALWGVYLESVFTRDKQIDIGVSAITCFLHACRHQNESKSRKYLAAVLWLLTYNDEKSTLAKAVDKYCVGVPPVQWLPWIPQLLTCLVRNEGRLIMNLICQVGRMYPQAVYFPIRTLYLTLKIERERYKTGGEVVVNPGRTNSQSGTSANPVLSPTTSNMPTMPEPTITAADTSCSTPMTSAGDLSAANHLPGQHDPVPTQARASASMWRCNRIMHMQRELHPTILLSLEGIVDQMVWFRENLYEEVLRQLKQGLTKFYAVAFENRAAVADATITPHLLNFVKKLVSTFGVDIENISSVVTTFSSAASESLARHTQATAQDPIFQKMKSQFTTDFDFSVPGSTKLHNMINKLKKWIKILEAKTKTLPKSFLIEEKCRFLSNFSLNTADVELPGEFLLPKHSNFYVKIARFMPRVEIVQKHNTAARRLCIRGNNGKIYPYLVVNDACLESRREELVLQLLRMLNHFLTKQKETSRRQLYFTVPRVVAVSPQMRLVEDNPASVSLLDVYQQRCSSRGIEHEAPIVHYYEHLLRVQVQGTQPSHQVLQDIFKDIQNNLVPHGLLKEWALHTFLDATEFWIFRKNFTVQLAVMSFAEFILHLTRMNADMMYFHQDCGYLSISYFKFDIDDQTGDLDANRPVPFRLTPNISEFLTSTGITGPLTASMISMARCFVQPQYKLASFLRAILRDEYIIWHKKKQEEINPMTEPVEMQGEQLISLVNKSVTTIMNRLQNLVKIEGADSRISTLVAAANKPDNLCRMDPAWHPWM